MCTCEIINKAPKPDNKEFSDKSTALYLYCHKHNISYLIETTKEYKDLVLDKVN